MFFGFFGVFGAQPQLIGSVFGFWVFGFGASDVDLMLPCAAPDGVIAFSSAHASSVHQPLRDYLCGIAVTYKSGNRDRGPQKLHEGT